MGEATVAACVVYDRMDMRRGEYRRYNIEGLAPATTTAPWRRRFRDVTAG